MSDNSSIFAAVPRSGDGHKALADHLRAFVQAPNQVADTVLATIFIGLLEQVVRTHAAR
jgi:hypothetical protein